VLWPYPLDVLPDYLGHAIARLFGWRPEGKKITLRVTESGDRANYGITVSGTIRQVLSNVVTTGPAGSTPSSAPCALIELDQPLIYMGQTIASVISLPRFKNHGLYRLLIAGSVVNVHRASNMTSSELEWKDVIAICVMRLERMMR
jgi:hypothetical protein